MRDDMKTIESDTKNSENLEQGANTQNRENVSSPQVIHDSDSETEDEILSRKVRNPNFLRLQNKARKIISSCLPTTNVTFPYDELESLYADLLKCAKNKSIKDVLWLNMIRWLLTMKRSFEGLLDLSNNYKFNLILTDFLASFINYKCVKYIENQNSCDDNRCRNEILNVLAVFFDEKYSFIFDTLLKVDLNPSYRKIICPIYKKYLSNKAVHETKDEGYNLKICLCYNKWKIFNCMRKEKGKVKEKILDQCYAGKNSVATLSKRIPDVKEKDVAARSSDQLAKNMESRPCKSSESRVRLREEILNLEETIREYFNSYKKLVYSCPSSYIEPSATWDLHNLSLALSEEQKKGNSSRGTTLNSHLPKYCDMSNKIRYRTGKHFSNSKQLIKNKSQNCNDSVIEVDYSSDEEIVKEKLIEVVDLLSDEEDEELKKDLESNKNMESRKAKSSQPSSRNVGQSSAIQNEVSSTTQNDYNFDREQLLSSSNNSSPMVHSSDDMGVRNEREVGNSTVNVIRMHSSKVNGQSFEPLRPYVSFNDVSSHQEDDNCGVEDVISSTSGINESTNSNKIQLHSDDSNSNYSREKSKTTFPQHFNQSFDYSAPIDVRPNMFRSQYPCNSQYSSNLQDMTQGRPFFPDLSLNSSAMFLNNQFMPNTFNSSLRNCNSENFDSISRRHNFSNNSISTSSNCDSVNLYPIKNNYSDTCNELPCSNSRTNSHCSTSSEYVSVSNKSLCEVCRKTTVEENKIIHSNSSKISNNEESDKKNKEKSQQIPELSNHVNKSQPLHFNSEKQINESSLSTNLASKIVEKSEKELLSKVNNLMLNDSNVISLTPENLLRTNSEDSSNVDCENRKKIILEKSLQNIEAHDDIHLDASKIDQQIEKRSSTVFKSSSYPLKFNSIEAQLAEDVIHKDKSFGALKINEDSKNKSKEQENKLIDKELTQELDKQLSKCNLGEKITNIEIKEAIQEVEPEQKSNVTSNTKKLKEVSNSEASLENCVQKISKLTCSEKSMNEKVEEPPVKNKFHSGTWVSSNRTNFAETYSVYMQSPKKREVKRLKCNDNSKQLNDKGSNQEQSDLYPEIAKSEFAIKNEKTVTNIEKNKLNAPTIFSNSELQSIPPKVRFKIKHSQNVKSEDFVVQKFEDAKSLEKSDKKMREMNDDAKITSLLERIDDVLSENESDELPDVSVNSKTVFSDLIKETENKEEEKLLNCIESKFIDNDNSINTEYKTEGHNSRQIPQETEVLRDSLDIKTYSEKSTNLVSIAESFQGILTASKEDSTENEEQNECLKENIKLDSNKRTEEIAILQHAQDITEISESNDISLTAIETLKITQENLTNIMKDDEVSAKRQLKIDITIEKGATNSQDPNKIDQSNERTTKSEDQKNSNLSPDINQIENTGITESCNEIPKEKATSDTSIENVEIKISSGDDKLETGLPHSETYIGENSQIMDKVKEQVSIGQNQSNEPLSKETHIYKEKSVTLNSSSSQVATTCEVSENVKELEASSLNYGNTETAQLSSDSFKDNSNLSSDMNQIKNTSMKESPKEIPEEKATSDTSVENVEIKISSDDKLEPRLGSFIGETSQTTDKVIGKVSIGQNESNEQLSKETEINKDKSVTLNSLSSQVSTTCGASENVKEFESSFLNYGNTEMEQQSSDSFEKNSSLSSVINQIEKTGMKESPKEIPEEEATFDTSVENIETNISFNDTLEPGLGHSERYVGENSQTTDKVKGQVSIGQNQSNEPLSKETQINKDKSVTLNSSSTQVSTTCEVSENVKELKASSLNFGSTETDQQRSGSFKGNSNLSSDINQIKSTGIKESLNEIPEEKATSDTSIENVEIKISSDDKLESRLDHSETYIGENSQTTNKVKGQVSIGQNQSNEQLSKETQINKEKSVTLGSSSSQISTCEASENVKDFEASSLNFGSTETDQQRNGSFKDNSNLSSDINQIKNIGMKESPKEIQEEKAASDISVENVEIRISSDDKLESRLDHTEAYIGENSQTTDKVKGQVSIGQNQSNEQLSKETQINKEKSVTLGSSSSQISTTCETSENVKELEYSSLNYQHTETEQQSGGSFVELSKKVTDKEEKILERFEEIQQSKNIELVEISQVIENSELTLDSSENLIKCEENLTNSLDEVQKITKHITISNEKEFKMNKKEEDCDAVRSDTKSTQSIEYSNEQIEWMRQLGLQKIGAENFGIPKKLTMKDHLKLSDTITPARCSERISLNKSKNNLNMNIIGNVAEKKSRTSRKRIDLVKNQNNNQKKIRSTRSSCTDSDKEEIEALNRSLSHPNKPFCKKSLKIVNNVLKSTVDCDVGPNKAEKKLKKSANCRQGKILKLCDSEKVIQKSTVILCEKKAGINKNKIPIVSPFIKEDGDEFFDISKENKKCFKSQKDNNTNNSSNSFNSECNEESRKQKINKIDTEKILASSESFSNKNDILKSFRRSETSENDAQPNKFDSANIQINSISSQAKVVRDELKQKELFPNDIKINENENYNRSIFEQNSKENEQFNAIRPEKDTIFRQDIKLAKDNKQINSNENKKMKKRVTFAPNVQMFGKINGTIKIREEIDEVKENKNHCTKFNEATKGEQNLPTECIQIMQFPVQKELKKDQCIKCENNEEKSEYIQEFPEIGCGQNLNANLNGLKNIHKKPYNIDEIEKVPPEWDKTQKSSQTYQKLDEFVLNVSFLSQFAEVKSENNLSEINPKVEEKEFYLGKSSQLRPRQNHSRGMGKVRTSGKKKTKNKQKTLKTELEEDHLPGSFQLNVDIKEQKRLNENEKTVKIEKKIHYSQQLSQMVAPLQSVDEVLIREKTQLPSCIEGISNEGTNASAAKSEDTPEIQKNHSETAQSEITQNEEIKMKKILSSKNEIVIKIEEKKSYVVYKSNEKQELSLEDDSRENSLNVENLEKETYEESNEFLKDEIILQHESVKDEKNSSKSEADMKINLKGNNIPKELIMKFSQNLPKSIEKKVTLSQGTESEEKKKLPEKMEQIMHMKMKQNQSEEIKDKRINNNLNKVLKTLIAGEEKNHLKELPQIKCLQSSSIAESEELCNKGSLKSLSSNTVELPLGNSLNEQLKSKETYKPENGNKKRLNVIQTNIEENKEKRSRIEIPDETLNQVEKFDDGKGREVTGKKEADKIDNYVKENSITVTTTKIVPLENDNIKEKSENFIEIDMDNHIKVAAEIEGMPSKKDIVCLTQTEKSSKSAVVDQNQDQDGKNINKLKYKNGTILKDSLHKILAKPEEDTYGNEIKSIKEKLSKDRGLFPNTKVFQESEIPLYSEVLPLSEVHFYDEEIEIPLEITQENVHESKADSMITAPSDSKQEESIIGASNKNKEEKVTKNRQYNNLENYQENTTSIVSTPILPESHFDIENENVNCILKKSVNNLLEDEKLREKNEIIQNFENNFSTEKDYNNEMNKTKVNGCYNSSVNSKQCYIKVKQIKNPVTFRGKGKGNTLKVSIDKKFRKNVISKKHVSDYIRSLEEEEEEENTSAATAETLVSYNDNIKTSDLKKSNLENPIGNDLPIIGSENIDVETTMPSDSVGIDEILNLINSPNDEVELIYDRFVNKKKTTINEWKKDCMISASGYEVAEDVVINSPNCAVNLETAIDFVNDGITAPPKIIATVNNNKNINEDLKDSTVSNDFKDILLDDLNDSPFSGEFLNASDFSFDTETCPIDTNNLIPFNLNDFDYEIIKKDFLTCSNLATKEIIDFNFPISEKKSTSNIDSIPKTTEDEFTFSIENNLSTFLNKNTDEFDFEKEIVVTDISKNESKNTFKKNVRKKKNLKDEKCSQTSLIKSIDQNVVNVAPSQIKPKEAATISLCNGVKDEDSVKSNDFANPMQLNKQPPLENETVFKKPNNLIKKDFVVMPQSKNLIKSFPSVDSSQRKRNGEIKNDIEGGECSSKKTISNVSDCKNNVSQSFEPPPNKKPRQTEDLFDTVKNLPPPPSVKLHSPMISANIKKYSENFSKMLFPYKPINDSYLNSIKQTCNPINSMNTEKHISYDFIDETSREYSAFASSSSSSSSLPSIDIANRKNTSFSAPPLKRHCVTRKNIPNNLKGPKKPSQITPYEQSQIDHRTRQSKVQVVHIAKCEPLPQQKFGIINSTATNYTRRKPITVDTAWECSSDVLQNLVNQNKKFT